MGIVELGFPIFAKKRDLFLNNTMDQQPNNPLHGITLQKILEYLLDLYGWEGLADKVNINCFKNEPSVTSSLKFLRKTPWARLEVEALYLRALKDSAP